MDTLKHIWYCWIRRCGYMPDHNWLALARFSGDFKVIHFDGKGYYIKPSKRG